MESKRGVLPLHGAEVILPTYEAGHLPALTQLINMEQNFSKRELVRKTTRKNSSVSKDDSIQAKGLELTRDSITLKQFSETEPRPDPFLSAVSFYTADFHDKNKKNKIKEAESWTSFSDQDTSHEPQFPSLYTDSGMIDLNLAIQNSQNDQSGQKRTEENSLSNLPLIPQFGNSQHKQGSHFVKQTLTTRNSLKGSFKRTGTFADKPTLLRQSLQKPNSVIPVQLFKQANIAAKKLEPFESIDYPAIPRFNKNLCKEKTKIEETRAEKEQPNHEIMATELISDDNQAPSTQNQPRTIPIQLKTWKRANKILQLSVIVEQEEKISVDNSTSALHQLSTSKVTSPRQSTTLIKSEVAISSIFAKKLTLEDIKAGINDADLEPEDKDPPKPSLTLHQKNPEEFSHLFCAAEVFLSKPPSQPSRLTFATAVFDSGLISTESLEAIKIMISLCQIHIHIPDEFLLTPKARTFYLILAGIVRFEKQFEGSPGETFLMDPKGDHLYRQKAEELKKKQTSLEINQLQSDNIRYLELSNLHDSYITKENTALLAFEAEDLRRVRQLCLRAGQKSTFGALLGLFSAILEEELWRELAINVVT